MKEKKSPSTYFSPKKDLKNFREIVTLDVETYTLDATKRNLWFGCIYTSFLKKVFYTTKELLKILSDPVFNNTIIYAHNGGGFDYLVLFGNILELETIYVGSRFIYTVLYIDRNGNLITKDEAENLKNNGEYFNKILLADSLNFYKTSLAELGKLIGFEKTELENKGNIKRGTIPSAKDIKYCFNDCMVLYEVMLKTFEGNKPCLTIGSLSLQIYQRFYLNKTIKFAPHIERMYVHSYFGGRTEAFELGDMECKVFDINSMYPFAMLNVRLPHPSYAFIRYNPKPRHVTRYMLTGEGMLHAKVKVPLQMKYPPLPYKNKEGRLLFPVGTFSGYWTITEMRYAMSIGVELLECYCLVGSSRIIEGKEIFGEFIEYFYNKKNTTDGFEKKYYKEILCNLYGKFGQHNFQDYKYFKNIEDAEIFIMRQEKFYEYKIEKYNEKRNDCLVVRNIDKLTSHSIISFASYITAESRILNHKYMVKYNPVYTDTDSFFIKKNSDIFPDTSDELGKLKEEEYIVTHISGCKSYDYIYKGELKIKLKGIPKKAEKIGINKYRFSSIIKPKGALRRSIEPGTVINIEKTVSGLYTKGTIHNNIVKPHIINE